MFETKCEQQGPRDQQPADLVRDVLQPDRIDDRHEQPRFLRQNLVVACERPRLPPRSRPRASSTPVVGERALLEHDPVAVEHRAHRREHVVEQRVRRGAGCHSAAPQRVDRAGRAERRPDRALVAPQPLLVFPVETDAVADARGQLLPRRRSRASARPVTPPTRGSAKFATSSDEGAGAQKRWRASAKTRMSPRRRRHARVQRAAACRPRAPR